MTVRKGTWVECDMPFCIKRTPELRPSKKAAVAYAKDIECLEVLGDYVVEVQVVIGDMPQVTFQQRPDKPGYPSAGKLSCGGLEIPARWGWDIFASRSDAFDGTSSVTLRITQRFVLRDEGGGGDAR